MGYILCVRSCRGLELHRLCVINYISYNGTRL
jgi:hypothetical protein